MTGTWRRGWINAGSGRSSGSAGAARKARVGSSIIAGLAVALAVVMVLHAVIPNGVRNLGSLVETFLPWLGLPIPILAALAVVRRSALAGIAVVLPLVVWLALFGEIVLPSKGGGAHDLRVLSNNVHAGNADPAALVRELLAADADVVALQEFAPDERAAYEEPLAQAYAYHTVRGTVGLWSRYPIAEAGAVDLRLGWDRALRAVVRAPAGDVAVYVAHMPSVRVDVDNGFTADQRDASAEALGETIAQDAQPRIILLADLNGTVYDRALAPITAQLESAQAAGGDGFGFSWPAAFPMARIDHVLIKGLVAARSWVLPGDGSDHRPVAADLRL